MSRNQHTVDGVNYVSFGALLIPVICYFMNGMIWEASLSAYADQHYFGIMLSFVSATYFYDYLTDRGGRWYNLIACVTLLGVAWCDMYNWPLWVHYTFAALFFGNTHISMIFRVKGLWRRITRTVFALILVWVLYFSFVNSEKLSLHDGEWINMIPMAFLLSGGANKKTYYQLTKEFFIKKKDKKNKN